MIQEEGTQCPNYLGIDLPEILVVGPERFGLGADSGSRQVITREREGMLAKVLQKSLDSLEDQSSMAVRSWTNRDKLSTAFLLDLPGPHNLWTSVEWGEAMCLILALPSNACKPFLGQKIGDRVVDKWGADVSCAILPGGSFIRRHDKVKSCLSSLATYCGLEYVCEPQSTFTAHIPQRPLNRVEAHQVRQGLRPDFIFRVPSLVSGQHEKLIADVKTISLGNKSLYRPGTRGVDLRAAKIQGEYRSIAKKVDQDLGHKDGQGPTSRKLAEFPPVLDLVFGAYGETSEGVKTLLDTLVKARLRKLGLNKGTSEAGKESAWVTGYLRRRLSSSVIKSNVSCLLERLVLVDEGGGQGGKRRQWAQMEEERGRLDRESQWLLKITGGRLIKTGSFLM